MTPPRGGWCPTCQVRYYGHRAEHDGPLDRCHTCRLPSSAHNARTGHDYESGGHEAQSRTRSSSQS